MTPQERDLVTALLARLKQHAAEAKDSEADALIRQALAQQPDAPYFLVQTVLMQDMALQTAQERMRQLEAQLTQAKPQPTSFLGGAARGSVPSAGVWTQSGATSAPPPPAAPWTQGAPLAAAPGGGSGFLQQAATTAAGIAGGALLFEGIRSLFGPHWGGGWLGGTAMQPSISETVINNYEGTSAPPAPLEADAGDDDLSGNDADIADADFGDGGNDFDV